MKRSRSLSRVVLTLSLALNLLFIAGAGIWVARKGGFRYFGEQLGLLRQVHIRKEWQQSVVQRYRQFPNTSNEIVFLGDSITASAPWSEHFSVIRNRGIGGDTTDGALQRLDEITESKPLAVFIQLGTNDLSNEIGPDEIVTNMRSIVDQIQAASPQTRVFIASVLPIRLPLRDNYLTAWKQKQIPKLNGMIRELCESSPGVTYIDTTKGMADEDGNLKDDYALDEMHLTDRGYQLMLKPFYPHVAALHPHMPTIADEQPEQARRASR